MLGDGDHDDDEDDEDHVQDDDYDVDDDDDKENVLTSVTQSTAMRRSRKPIRAWGGLAVINKYHH